MAALRHYAMLTNLPVSLMIIAPAFPFQVYLRWGQRPFSISVLNVKALVGAFNQKKAFSVIMKTNGSFAALVKMVLFGESLLAEIKISVSAMDLPGYSVICPTVRIKLDSNLKPGYLWSIYQGK